MKIYRNGKTLQARGGGGRFRQWDLDGDFGARRCGRCRGFAVRPEIRVTPSNPFIDPADWNRRVCPHCGWDSTVFYGVNLDTVLAATWRLQEVGREWELAVVTFGPLECWPPDVLGILLYQYRRERRRAEELQWLAEEVSHVC